MALSATTVTHFLDKDFEIAEIAEMEYHYTSNPLTSQFRKSSLAISFPHTRKDFLPVYYSRPPLMLPHAFYCKIQNKIEVCRGKKDMVLETS